MAQQTAAKSSHVHGPTCGHTKVSHEGHIDYIDQGKLCHPEAGSKVSEHVIPVTKKNPNACTPDHDCGNHEAGHVHGPGCGHEAVPHGDHIDYLVDGHLHHPHDGHCDNHGQVALAGA